MEGSVLKHGVDSYAIGEGAADVRAGPPYIASKTSYPISNK